MTSVMRETMDSQPALLRDLLADPGPVETAAGRLRGRRVLLSGTGTSWHAANHGAWLLRAAGVTPGRSRPWTWRSTARLPATATA